MSRNVATKRPNGGQIIVWIAIVFSGVLAFINASIATSGGMRLFLIVCGIVIMTVFVVIVGRWYFKGGSPRDRNSS